MLISAPPKCGTPGAGVFNVRVRVNLHFSPTLGNTHRATFCCICNKRLPVESGGGALLGFPAIGEKCRLSVCDFLYRRIVFCRFRQSQPRLNFLRSVGCKSAIRRAAKLHHEFIQRLARFFLSGDF